MTESQQGRVLVAGPSLGDPNFDRTIVYLLEHREDGALGVVLNRPSAIELADALPSWADLAASPPVVFAGGPVEMGVVVGLAVVQRPFECAGWSPVAGPVGTVDLSMAPDAIDAGIESARVFAGYAGWGPAQLDEELDAGAWFVVDAADDDLFTSTPEQLWGAVLRRDEAISAMAAGNPSWN